MSFITSTGFFAGQIYDKILGLNSFFDFSFPPVDLSFGFQENFIVKSWVKGFTIFLKNIFCCNPLVCCGV